jgi:hypothetical protein
MTRSKIIILLIVLCLFTLSTSAQTNSNEMPAAFQSLIGDLKLKIDTTSPPEDSLTKKIRIFRVERSSISFDTIIKYQIESQQTNDTTHPKEYYLSLLDECQHGSAHHLIENILINLYRQCFTEKEMDQLVEFYKTSVGKRMMIDIFMITATAGTAIQQIVKVTSEKIDQKMKSGSKMK